MYSQHHLQCLNHFNLNQASTQVLVHHPLLTKDHPQLFLSHQWYADCCILLL